MANEPVQAEIQDNATAAVSGTNTGDGPGVFGESHNGIGVSGKTNGGPQGFSGVFGESVGGAGVSGHSTNSVGVDARSQNGPAAMRAIGAGGTNGVIGRSDTGIGVSGKTNGGPLGSSGVFGESVGGAGVAGRSTNSVGVDARTANGPAAIRAIHEGVGLAGLFGGDVSVTRNVLVDGNIDVKGDIRLANADCAEDFDIADAAVEPGTVMVLNDAGELAASMHPYDRRVAGVASGAGAYKPGIVLDKRETGAVRQPIALLGKVFCKVDAQFRAISVGDLLTTSPTPGHAMATSDPIKAFGAVIGKALRPLPSGQGLIPILISLQ
jgi:hypothetical protein